MACWLVKVEQLQLPRKEVASSDRVGEDTTSGLVSSAPYETMSELHPSSLTTPTKGLPGRAGYLAKNTDLSIGRS